MRIIQMQIVPTALLTFFSLTQLSTSEGKPEINFNPQLNESTTMSKNSPMRKSLDLPQQPEEKQSALKRKTEWSQKETTVRTSKGVSLSATLYTAKYELPDYGHEPDGEGEKKIGILNLSIEGLKITWIADIPIESEDSVTFIENDGEVYGCAASGPNLRVWRNSLSKSKQAGEFIFSNDGLDQLVIEALPISRYFNGSIFDLRGFFEEEFFYLRFTVWNSPMHKKMLLKTVSAENGIFCFEIEIIFLRRRGRLWVDIGNMKILKTENITHLIEPKEKVELKTNELLPWKAESSPVKTTTAASFSLNVLTSAGSLFPVDLYSTAMEFNKTITGEVLREMVRVFHANRQNKEDIWIDVYRPVTSAPLYLIEANNELITCYSRLTFLRLVNTAVKIEKPNKDFVFSEDTLDELFADSYSKFPNLPYKFCMNTIDLADFFDKDFFKEVPSNIKGVITKETTIEKITAEDGIFCFEIRNFTTNRLGKVWIDPQTYKVVKAEEIIEPPKSKTLP